MLDKKTRQKALMEWKELNSFEKKTEIACYAIVALCFVAAIFVGA